jgi:hypothetical protein
MCDQGLETAVLDLAGEPDRVDRLVGGEDVDADVHVART